MGVNLVLNLGTNRDLRTNSKKRAKNERPHIRQILIRNKKNITYYTKTP